MEVFHEEIQKTSRDRRTKTLPVVNLGEIRDLYKNGNIKSYLSWHQIRAEVLVCEINHKL